jgi:hypothetical protein
VWTRFSEQQAALDEKLLPGMMKKQDQRSGGFDGVRRMKDFVRAQIREAELFLEASKKYLEELERISGQTHTTPIVTDNTKIIDVVLFFLDQAKKPQSLETIVEQMKDWGVAANVRDQEAQIIKSIDFNLLTQQELRERYPHMKNAQAKLKRFSDLIGRAEWKDEL